MPRPVFFASAATFEVDEIGVGGDCLGYLAAVADCDDFVAADGHGLGVGMVRFGGKDFGVIKYALVRGLGEGSLKTNTKQESKPEPGHGQHPTSFEDQMIRAVRRALARREPDKIAQAVVRLQGKPRVVEFAVCETGFAWPNPPRARVSNF